MRSKRLTQLLKLKMFLSIIVYLATAAIMWLLCDSVVRKERKALIINPKYNTASFQFKELWLCVFIFSFVAGARYNTGVDHLRYLESYELLSKGYLTREDIEQGFLWLEQLFVNLDLHYFFWFAFLGGVQVFFILYSQRTYKEVLPYVCAMIMLGPFFMTWMNGIRQCVVMCVFVWLIEFAGNYKKLILWVVALLLCATIHKSAIILLPLFFVGVLGIINRGPLVNYIILAVCFIIGLTPKFYNLLAPLLPFLEANDEFARYSNDLERLLMEETTRTMGVGPERLANLAVSCFIIGYYPQMKRFYNKKILGYYFILFLLGIWLYNLFINTSHLFLRPIMYLTVFQLPLFGYCMVYLKKNNKQTSFIVLGIIAFMQAIVAAMRYGLIGGSKLSDRFLYHFFFLQ